MTIFFIVKRSGPQSKGNLPLTTNPVPSPWGRSLRACAYQLSHVPKAMRWLSLSVGTHSEEVSPAQIGDNNGSALTGLLWRSRHRAQRRGMAGHASQDSFYSRSRVGRLLHAFPPVQPDARIDQKPCLWRSLRWADADPWGQKLQTRLEETQGCQSCPRPARQSEGVLPSATPLFHFWKRQAELPWGDSWPVHSANICFNFLWWVIY